MRVSTKVGIAFCLAAGFLLAVEIGAIYVIDHINSILGDTTVDTMQLDQIDNAMRAYRVTPDHTSDHLARLEDLDRWARTDAEHVLITGARDRLKAGRPVGDVAEFLDELRAGYLQKTIAAHERLLTIHHRVVIGLIVIMVDSVVLFFLLTALMRAWLIRPLKRLDITVAQLMKNDPTARVPQLGDAEFIQIATTINQLNKERHDLREQIEQSARLAIVGEATTHVTHNVRSLLGSIRSLAQHESNAAGAPPNTRVGFNYIIALVNKLDGWVRDIHSQASNLKPRLAAHHIEPIIHDTIQLLEPKLTEKAIQLDFQADDDLPRALIDRGLFEQAFLVVLSNAIEAAPDESQIGVHISNGTPDRVTIIITDQGPGMNEATRQRAFDPFFTTKPESPGLGLTIARTIVKNHGGEIVIESEEKKGTRVVMQFPTAGRN